MQEVRPERGVRADLWTEWRGGPTVHCFLCAHHCRIAPGDRGLCGVRENRDGTLFTLVYACAVSTAVDPVEKKPLYHFMPGTRTYSLATVGCNFTCAFCQNAEISQMPRDRGRVVGTPLSPGEAVEEALESGCGSISFTYTEPTIFYEYARDCARAAVKQGLKNIFVTNGYMTREMLNDIDGDLHAANVDLKSYSDVFYRTLVGARLKPVLDSIRRLWEMGVWVEVTTLLISGKNDSPGELRSLAEFLASVSADIPWHVSRFHPAYRMLDTPPTAVATIETALRIGREAGLKYLYGGNVAGHASESTACPSCGTVVVERNGFRVGKNAVRNGRCAVCGTEIAGRWSL